MRANLGPAVNLDFLDGYLFRLLQEIAGDRGLGRSGFETYYGHRLAEKIGGLIEYEERLARYLLDGYAGRRVVHAGIGIGTLACALACNGMTVAGIEFNRRRVKSAHRLRAAIIEIWPEVEGRYEIIQGVYPTVLTAPPIRTAWLPSRRSRPSAPSGWLDANAILVFTNVAYSWSETVLAAIIDTMPRFAEVLLDLRTFGIVREDDRARTALFERIAASARSAERLPDLADDMHYARFVFA
jgi:hypothetical protein